MLHKFSINGSFTLQTKQGVPSGNIMETFCLNENNCAAVIICSHDGVEVSGLFLEHLKSLLKSNDFTELTEYSEIKEYLEFIFSSFDTKYLKSAEQYIKKRTLLNDRLSNIEFDSEFETLMKSIEEIERILKCGCTLSLAILLHDKLYIAGLGDNEIIAFANDDNSEDHLFSLLTEEHSFYNEVEIRRIKDTCLLSANALRNLCGKTFSKYHSRCLGHYEMKCEYMKFDNFKDSKSSPLVCLPHITEAHSPDASQCYLLLVSSGLYYIVMELIYDRDKIAGEIAHEFQEVLRRCGEGNLSAVCEAVVRRCLESHAGAFGDLCGECECEELSLMAVRLPPFLDGPTADLDWPDSMGVSVAPESIVPQPAASSQTASSSSGLYASLTRSLASALPANTVPPYVSFHDWIQAEQRLSAADLDDIDCLLSSPLLEDTAAIVEEDESTASSRFSRAATLNDATDDEEPLESLEVRAGVNI